MDVTCGHCGETNSVSDPAPEALEEHRSQQQETFTNEEGNEGTRSITVVQRGVTVRCDQCGERTFHAAGAPVALAEEGDEG